MARIRALRTVYLNIAHASADARRETSLEDVDIVDTSPGMPQGVDREESTADRIPLNWRTLVGQGKIAVPLAFQIDVFDFFLQQDSATQQGYPITWVELVFMLQQSTHVEFPVQDAISGQWKTSLECPLADRRLSLSAKIRLVKTALCTAVRQLGLELSLLSSLSLIECGVIMRVPGLLMGCRFDQLTLAREALCNFTARRPIRSCADLSRPT